MTLRPRLATGAALLLLTGGLCALGYVAYAAVDASAYQAEQRRVVEGARRSAHASASPAAPAPPREGDPMGILEVPRLGISVAVVHGDSVALLERAVGHISDTALPGETGNVTLAGHRDTFFRPLEHVRAGDTIRLSTATGEFHYLVESTIVVGPGDLWVLAPIGGRTLTLITCFPFGYIGAAPDRFVVRAREMP